MKKFDLAAHQQYVSELSKRALKGDYPSPKVAKIGSSVGMVIGAGLIIIGVVGSLADSLWWIGSLLAGISTVLSNLYQFKRLRNQG